MSETLLLDLRVQRDFGRELRKRSAEAKQDLQAGTRANARLVLDRSERAGKIQQIKKAIYASPATAVSTAFSQEPEVGVKWNVQRGCRASQAFTFGCLWVA